MANHLVDIIKTIDTHPTLRREVIAAGLSKLQEVDGLTTFEELAFTFREAAPELEFYIGLELRTSLPRESPNLRIMVVQGHHHAKGGLWLARPPLKTTNESSPP